MYVRKRSKDRQTIDVIPTYVGTGCVCQKKEFGKKNLRRKTWMVVDLIFSHLEYTVLVPEYFSGVSPSFLFILYTFLRTMYSI